MEEQKNQLLEKIKLFLKKKEPKLCVLSTASEGAKPEAAVLAYSIKDDLTVILTSKKSARKVHNIRKNPKVALVFGWNFHELYLQCEGIAMIVEKDEGFLKYQELFYTDNPQAKNFDSKENIFIEVTPKWFRVADPSIFPPQEEEITIS